MFEMSTLFLEKVNSYVKQNGLSVWYYTYFYVIVLHKSSYLRLSP
jgi:hypothetical protein